MTGRLVVIATARDEFWVGPGSVTVRMRLDRAARRGSWARAPRMADLFDGQAALGWAGRRWWRGRAAGRRGQGRRPGRRRPQGVGGSSQWRALVSVSSRSSFDPLRRGSSARSCMSLSRPVSLITSCGSPRSGPSSPHRQGNVTCDMGSCTRLACPGFRSTSPPRSCATGSTRAGSSLPRCSGGRRGQRLATTHRPSGSSSARRSSERPVCLSSLLRDRLLGPLGVADELASSFPALLLDRVVRQVAPSGPPRRALPRAAHWPARCLRRRPDAAVRQPPRRAHRADPLVEHDERPGAACVYAALLGHVPGFRPLSESSSRPLPPLRTLGEDQVMEMAKIRWSLGYSPDRPGGARSRSGSTFGMVGTNGSAAYADIDTGVAVALMRNRSPRTSRRSPG